MPRLVSRHHGGMNTAPHVDRRPAVVIDAEDRLSVFLSANYGPTWGHVEQDIADRMERDLVALYDRHNIPSDDRLAGL